MLVSLALLLACYWLLGRVLRGGVVSAMAGWVQRGRPTIPLAFTVRPVPVPAGDDLLFAGRASLWSPAPSPAPAGGVWRVGFGRRRALEVRRGAGPGPRVRWSVLGRDRRAGGLLVVTNRRVLFRGRGPAASAAREDVPLGDVANLRLEGPLLSVERRSRSGQPLAVTVATPAPVAKMIAAAAQAALARTPAAPARGAAPRAR